MSIWEYNERMKGVLLRDLDQQFSATWTAWANREFSQTDEKGYFRIKRFSDLFDYEKLERRYLGLEDKEKINKLNELKERSDRAQRAKEQARKIIEERRKINGN